jgi:membrane protein DedA with SNARE-associated domain
MSDLIHSILQFFEQMGYWGVMLGLMIEVIPSEIVLSYAGYLVSKGEISFVGAVFFGTVGGVIAQIFVYWLGRYAGRPFLERYGKYIFIHKKHIDVAEQWFNRYGTGMIFTARFIPVVRHAISIPAGMAKMSHLRFIFYTTLAVIPWSILFIYLGMTLKDNWQKINEIAGPYVKPFVIASVILTVLYLLYKILFKKRGGEDKYGDEGEKNTAHQLRYIGKEYRVLNSRRIHAGGGTQEFDHIVVGPNGVFHIDSKHWSGEIKFTETGVERSKEGHSEDPTSQLYRHEHVMKELRNSHHIQTDVVGILCFTHPSSHLIGKSPAFATVKVDRLLHTIKNYKSKKTLGRDTVLQIEKLIIENSKSSK